MTNDKRSDKARKDWTPGQAEKQRSEDDVKVQGTDVEPITVVCGKPEEGNEEAEQVRALNKPNLQESGNVMVSKEDEEKERESNDSKKDNKNSNAESCWNCNADLDEAGVCGECSFEKDKLENADLNAQRSREARMRMVREGTL